MKYDANGDCYTAECVEDLRGWELSWIEPTFDNNRKVLFVQLWEPNGLRREARRVYVSARLAADVTPRVGEVL